MPIYAAAETPPAAQETLNERYPLMLDAFNVDYYSSQGSPEWLGIERGGKDIVSFENLGLYQTTNDRLIYQGRLVLKYEANFFTLFNLNNIYTGGTYRAIREIEWLKLITDPNWETARDRATHHYFVTWADWNLWNPSHGINGHMAINVSFVDLRAKYFQGEEGEQFVVTAPQISPVTTYSRGYYEQCIDDYKDEFVGGESEAIVEVNDLTVDNSWSQADGDASDVGEQINALNLGARLDPTTPNLMPAYQRERYFPSDGTDLQKSDNNLFVVPIINTPNVGVYEQRVWIRFCELSVDTQDGIILGSAGIENVGSVCETSYLRSAGYRVTNYNIHAKFETSFICFTEVLMDIDDQAEYLANPEYKKGDMVWDLAFGGDTGVGITLNPNTGALTTIGNKISDWFAQYKWVIYAAIGLVVVVMVIRFLAPVLLMRREQ